LLPPSSGQFKGSPSDRRYRFRLFIYNHTKTSF